VTDRLYDRLYYALLRQRDELRYQVEMQTKWLAEKQAKLADVEARIAEYERKGGD